MALISPAKVILTVTSKQASQAIFNIRHDIHAGELNQHQVNSKNLLKMILILNIITFRGGVTF
jgi:hypothetical protein